jgi:hypothetical protein
MLLIRARNGDFLFRSLPERAGTPGFEPFDPLP